MSLKRPGGDTAPVKEDPAAAHARKVFAGMSRTRPEEPSKKQSVNFYVDPGDYEALKGVAADMGIGIGAALRIALRDFLKRKGVA